jgi:hypothetical protein
MERDESKEIYHLKLGGMDFVEIAQRYQITTDVAMQKYRSYLVEAAKTFGGDQRDMVVQTELARLDSLQQTYWHSALQGERADGEFVLKVMAHRMKLLGLDQLQADTKQQIAQVLVVGGSQQEFIDALNAGRNQQVLAGPSPEDGDDLEVD